MASTSACAGASATGLASNTVLWNRCSSSTLLCAELLHALYSSLIEVLLSSPLSVPCGLQDIQGTKSHESIDAQREVGGEFWGSAANLIWAV